MCGHSFPSNTPPQHLSSVTHCVDPIVKKGCEESERTPLQTVIKARCECDVGSQRARSTGQTCVRDYGAAHYRERGKDAGSSWCVPACCCWHRLWPYILWLHRGQGNVSKWDRGYHYKYNSALSTPRLCSHWRYWYWSPHYFTISKKDMNNTYVWHDQLCRFIVEKYLFLYLPMLNTISLK